jgi:hypothetical protein
MLVDCCFFVYSSLDLKLPMQSVHIATKVVRIPLRRYVLDTTLCLNVYAALHECAVLVNVFMELCIVFLFLLNLFLYHVVLDCSSFYWGDGYGI